MYVNVSSLFINTGLLHVFGFQQYGAKYVILDEVKRTSGVVRIKPQSLNRDDS